MRAGRHFIGGGEAGEAVLLQWLVLKELQLPQFEGAGYRCLKRGERRRLMGE
jgi:hypothetical protein